MIDKAEVLQKRMAEIDLHSSRSNSDLSFLVLKLQNLKIKMYQEKHHQSPHIHIDYGKNEHTASFCIETGKRIVGSYKELAKKYDKVIGEWLGQNKAQLLELWEVTQASGDTGRLIAFLRANT
ncbi:DUF4160 domain-containing protein [Vibrio sp. Vb5031]|uniref:DUF4160 domain-containing protein n=1 Tax=Vibrio sp. Vb5031 TaxID=3074699 RepID=UPI002963DBC4|nr:DUF4160 domain-containing protein [Vibrio sp. Vb5031]MDW1504315.1 DUF4160 domain-containing protein [Vibrio sp. Vb5031]